MIGGNLLDEAWIKTVLRRAGCRYARHCLHRGVFAYLNQTEIQQALTHLHEAFAGRCTVIFDALSRAWAKRSDNTTHCEAHGATSPRVDSEGRTSATKYQ